MKPRIYLDTSVLSALDDARAPDRQALTREFFDRLGDFEASTSEATRREIMDTRDPARRDQMLPLLDRMLIHPINQEALDLAARYMTAAIFPASVPDDALHVALAVLTHQDVLVSWNFKHLVNRRRRAAVAALNLSLGLRTPDILPPPEL